jgi:hypothetical protein
MPVIGCAKVNIVWSTSPRSPYYDYGRLLFNDNRFYGVVLDLPADKFEGAEKAVLARIGTSPRQTRSTVQNRFGAQFHQLEDFWQVGNVLIYFDKRAGKFDEGMRYMAYDPLAPKRHDQTPACAVLVQILAEALAAEAVGELLKRGRNSKVYECTVWLRWKSAVYQDQVVASAGRGRGRMNLKILDSAHYGEELPGAATRADPMDPYGVALPRPRRTARSASAPSPAPCAITVRIEHAARF